MVRRMLLALALTALCSTAVPAQAHTDTCAFTGTLWTFGPPLPTVTVVPGPTVDFVMATWFPTTCATGTPPLLGGTMTGSVLGTTTGSGTATGGHDFAFTGAAGTLDVAGQVAGVLSMTPDPLTSTGDTFLVRGHVVLHH